MSVRKSSDIEKALQYLIEKQCVRQTSVNRYRLTASGSDLGKRRSKKPKSRWSRISEFFQSREFWVAIIAGIILTLISVWINACMNRTAKATLHPFVVPITWKDNSDPRLKSGSAIRFRIFSLNEAIKAKARIF